MDLISLRAPIMAPRGFSALARPPLIFSAPNQNRHQIGRLASKISRVRIFAATKFHQHEISLQWMRNFAKMTAKFRLTKIRECFDEISWRNFAKFRRIFTRTMNDKHQILFAFLLHRSELCFFIRSNLSLFRVPLL